MRAKITLFLSLLFINAIAQPKFDIQGQRGARGILPENTIPSATKALELGATTLSLNAVISKDKKVVLSHVPYFNNETTTTPEGKFISLKDEKTYNMYNMDYAEIKKFDVGMKTHARFPGQQKIPAYKPLLEDLIDSVELFVRKNKLPKPYYNIETKTIPKGDLIFHPEPSEFIELIMDVVKRKKMEKRVIIQSFDIRTLQYLHEKYPSISTSLLIDEKENFEENIKNLGFKPTIYSPYSVLVGKSLVDRCKAAGIKIIPWTVNTVKDIIYLQNLGVDGIITDYPNLMNVVKQQQSD